MCNLTTVIARSHDTLESLLEKVETATVIGTIQSLGTHFPTLRRPQWKTNAEEERLLGVSIGGQQDCPLLTGYQGAEVMTILRQHAIATNDMYARQLGIAQSASITCVKPAQPHQ
jgi:ribonucleoside-triphosphate reductase